MSNQTGSFSGEEFTFARASLARGVLTVQLDALCALCGSTAVASQHGHPTWGARPAGLKGAHMEHEQH